MKSQSVNTPKRNPPQLTWGTEGNLHSDIYQYLQKGEHDSFVICHSASYFFGTIDTVTVLYFIFRKFLSFNWMRKYNETILSTTNTVYFKQESPSTVNMTFMLGPANGISLAQTFWPICFMSSISSHLVNASYASTTAMHNSQQLDKTLLLSLSSGFDWTFRTWFILTSHMLHSDPALQFQLTDTHS